MHCIEKHYRVSLKKRSLTRLAPLEAPRLLIGLEISPKCYQILYIGQTYPFTHFNTIYGWFPPNYGPKYGPFKQNKFHCFVWFSKSWGEIEEDQEAEVDCSPVSTRPWEQDHFRLTRSRTYNRLGIIKHVWAPDIGKHVEGFNTTANGA